VITAAQIVAGFALVLIGLAWSFYWHHQAVYPRRGIPSWLAMAFAILGVVPIVVGIFLIVWHPSM